MLPPAGGSTWYLYSVCWSRNRRRLISLSASAKRSAITAKLSVFASQLGQRSGGLGRSCTSLRRFTASGCSESGKGALRTGGVGSSATKFPTARSLRAKTPFAGVLAMSTSMCVWLFINIPSGRVGVTFGGKIINPLSLLWVGPLQLPSVSGHTTCTHTHRRRHAQRHSKTPQGWQGWSSSMIRTPSPCSWLVCSFELPSSHHSLGGQNARV